MRKILAIAVFLFVAGELFAQPVRNDSLYSGSVYTSAWKQVKVSVRPIVFHSKIMNDGSSGDSVYVVFLRDTLTAAIAADTSYRKRLLKNGESIDMTRFGVGVAIRSAQAGNDSTTVRIYLAH